MGIKLDHVVVLDLEATCWGGSSDGQVSEIIEIGVCKLNFNHSITKPRSIYVWPLLESKISDFCTSLTGITTEILKVEGMAFDGAMNTLLKEYGPTNRITATWGNYDARMIRQQCAKRGVPYPLGDTILNVKDLYAWFTGRKPCGLSKAVTRENLEFEGKPHSGVSDAIMTAKILRRIQVH